MGVKKEILEARAVSGDRAERYTAYSDGAHPYVCTVLLVRFSSHRSSLLLRLELSFKKI